MSQENQVRYEVPTELRNNLDKFAASMGMSGLPWDDEAHCCLVFDGKLRLHLQYDFNREAVLLYADLGPLPEDRREEALEVMMRGNLFWRATRGATLSLHGDPETNVLLADRLATYELTPVLMEKTVEHLLATAEDWTEYLAVGGGAVGEAPAADDSVSIFNLRV